MTAAAAASCSYAARSLPLLGAIWPTKWRPLSSHHRIYIDSVGRSVGPTHLSITYCSGCIAHLLLVEEKSELSHILPASRPARLNRNVRFSFRDNLRFPTGSHPYSFFGKMECRFRQTVRRCSVQAGKERNSGYFGRMRSSKIKGRTPFKRCLLPAC